MRALVTLATSLLLFAVVACSDDDDTDTDDDPAGEEPAGETDEAEAGGADDEQLTPGDDWEVQDPADQGMDDAGIDEALDYAFTDGRNTQGVVVVRDGAIVSERYDEDADADSLASSWSVAKSFTSALIGIAIEEGLIPSVDEPMTTYYPDWDGTPREDITLRDMLQMASGLEFTESYDPDDLESSDIIQLVLQQEDQLAYAAERPAAEEPGTRFNYSSGDTLLLSGVLEQATGMPAAEYAAEVLLGPIGMDDAEWWQDMEGNTLTYCCLDTTTRGFARFGLLYLREGTWAGDEVVPADWVAESLEPSTATDGEGYGYQWWLTGLEDDDLPDDTYSARGHDGQFIYVVPSLDLVVVRNGTYIRYDGEAVAEPNLYARLPNDIVDDLGTTAPDPDVGWNDAEFLGPIVAAVDADADADADA